MPSAAIARPILIAVAGSHAGLQRDNNEDRFHCDPQRGVFMVVDGVGGQAAGEKAAETALAMVRARLERETGTPAERVREAITLANNEIFRLAATVPAWKGMACVLTLALVRDGRVTVGHVGDTRLYAFSDGILGKVTHDHSPIGEREDRGDIDEMDAMHHPRRNEIYRDVGSQHHDPGDADFIETLEFPFEADTALVLCTDGLSDMIPSARVWQIVAEHAGDPARVVERLIEAANAAGGKDNVTAVFVAGPRFAEAVRRQPARSASLAGRSEPARGGIRRMATSWPAVTIYGVLAGLLVAAALMIATDRVPAALLSTARPAGWSRTVVVGPQPDADFSTVQQALRRARPGDVVRVEAGTYDLPIVVPAGVNLVAAASRQAVLRTPPDADVASPGLQVTGRTRVSGFKVDGGGRLTTAVSAEEGEALLEDLEIVGAAGPAVVFGPRSRGTLRASYLHDNRQVAVVVAAQALPQVLHNVVTGNGKPAAPGARAAEGGAHPAAPAVLLQAGASAVFFGNIISGNGDDQVAGLAPEKRADLIRDNVIGPVAARAPAPPPRTGPRPGRGM